MVNTQELLDKEEQEALNALQEAQKVSESTTEQSQNIEKNVESERQEVLQDKNSVSSESKEELNDSGISLDPIKANDPKYLKARFLTTAGMSKKLAEEKKILQKEAELIKQENERLKKQFQEKIDVSNNSNINEIELVDDKDFEDTKKTLLTKYEVPDGFIDEIIGLSEKKSKTKVAKVEKELDDLKKKFETMATSNENNRFWNNVFDLAPDAKQVFDNDELAFRAYLDQNNYGNITNGEIYNFAIQKGDAKTIAQMVKDFKKEISPLQNINNKNNVNEIPDSIKRQVTPKSIQSSLNSVSGGRVFTTSEIDRLYQESAMGRIGNDEWSKIESEIHSAVLDGRVHD